MALEDMGYASYLEITLSNGGYRGRSIFFEEYTYKISTASIQPGDILQSPGHVELYLGNGYSLHGGYPTNNHVVVAPTTKTVYEAYRFDGSISTQDIIDKETAMWEEWLKEKDN